MKLLRIVFCLVFLLILVGCGTKPVPIPVFKSSPVLDVGPKKSLIPFRLGKVQFKIRRGTPVGAYHVGDTLLCSCADGGLMHWNSGKLIFGNWQTECGEFFYEVMKGRGYNVAGDPTKLYDTVEDAMRARLSISASITDMKANICNNVESMNCMSLGTQTGVVYLKVVWHVRDGFTKKTLLKVETTGYSKSSERKSQGFKLLLYEAFASAAEELANAPKFHALVSGKVKLVKEPTTIDTPLRLRAVKPFVSKLTDNAERVVDSVVTIRSTVAHGSGFIISKDGYVLTNYHVVGEADKVVIAFDSGIEVSGKVVRRHPIRDVALIKLDITRAVPLPLRFKPVKIGEPVYAIGSPLATRFKSTVTKGIVSAVRFQYAGTSRMVRLPLIQADVDIQGGNSGGALVDDKGNIVGITVSGIGMMSIGMNFFIPIKSALEYLNIEYGSK